MSLLGDEAPPFCFCSLKKAGQFQLRNELVNAFNHKQLVPIAMQDLQHIWQWPPEPDVDYYYPSKRDWFDTPESIGKRIADTRNVS